MIMVTNLLASLLLLFLLPPTLQDRLRSQPQQQQQQQPAATSSGGNNTAADVAVSSSSSSSLDPRTERRLRERWDAFVESRSRPVAIDPALSSPEEVHAVAGKDLYLSCGLTRPLAGRLRISFLRLADLNLLSVGRRMHTPDTRIQVLHSEVEAPRVWTIRIRDATESDSGAYECQVNTPPAPGGPGAASASRRIIRAVVVRSSVALRPPDQVVYLNAGSRLALTCVVKAGGLSPQFIMWYRDDRIVSYSSGDDDGGQGTTKRRGGVRTRLWTEEEPPDNSSSSSFSSSSSSLSSGVDDVGSFYPQHLSELVVDSVTESDSGEYRCDSDLTGEARVSVYVVRADLKSLHVGASDADGGADAVGAGGGGAAAAAASVAATPDVNVSVLLITVLLTFFSAPVGRRQLSGGRCGNGWRI